MMEARELRIGNWIECSEVDEFGNLVYKAYQVSVSDIWNIRYNEIRKKEYETIPLTEEWLKDFGFPWEIKFQANGNDEFWGLFSECYPKEKGYNLIMKRDKILLIPEIKYVHQLQNLYFALTGKELELK